MPLHRRIPKRGFTNINRVEYQVVNLRDLDRLDPGEVTPGILFECGLIGTLARPVKILGMGEVEGVFQISAHRFSGTARDKIEGAGGTVTVLGGPATPDLNPEPAVEVETESEEASDPEVGDVASETEDEQA
jgi:ribosomal protein L15